MPRNTRLTPLAVNTEADALARLLDGGWLDLMDGEQPDDGGAITTQIKLARCGFAATSAPAAVDGVLTFSAMAPETDAPATTATGASWARCYRADGATAVMDLSVGLADANVILDDVMIRQHATVTLGGFTHSVAKSTAGS